MTTERFRSQKLSRIGRSMSRSMAKVTSEAALSQVAVEVGLDAVLEDRRSRTEPRSVTSYLLWAMASVLPDHPMLNARLATDGRSVEISDDVNLGLAVATDEGLIVPVVHRAQSLDLGGIAAEVERLATAARSGELTVDDVTGGTFTVSNLGMFGVDSGFALPPPPQGAILLVGRSRRVFVPDENDQPVVRNRAWCGLTFDHRFVDGATAAALLADFDAALAAVGPTTPPESGGR